MPAEQVTDAEVCWVVAALQPASVEEVAARLPIGQNATYSRLRHLFRAGRLARESAGRKHTYQVTPAGQELIAEAELPPTEETDLLAFFSNREGEIDGETVLEALASLGDSWAITPQVVDRVPVSATMTRTYLHRLVEAGAVELDDSEEPYKWRLTNEGRARLSEDTEAETGQRA